MQKWLLKSMVQKAISFLPQAHKINYEIQKLTTLRHGMPDFFFEDRLSHFTDHYNFFKKYSPTNLSGSKILELGTGWHPIVPIGFYLSGAKEIITVDIRNLISEHSLNQTLQKFRQYYQNGNLLKFIPDLKPERMQHILDLTASKISGSPYQNLNKLNIAALIQDARELSIPDNSLDFIVSNNVIMEIQPSILENIMKEFVRISKPGSMMSLAIDFADQYVSFDDQISPLNYLQFSEKYWNFVTNKLVRRNRKLIPYYRDLFRNLNLSVLEEVNILGKREILDSINLHPDFKQFSEAELLILHSHMVVRV